MERAIVGSVRGLLCLAAFASLAACGYDESSSTDTAVQPQSPSAQLPTHPSEQQPTIPSNPPATEQPTTPPSEPTDPTEPTDPVTPPTSDNAAPTISGTPSAEATVGQAFSFKPNAADADGDDLTFSIQSKPSWASFNSATGRLSGTPAAGDVGSHEQIVISVSDGHSSRSLPQFAINVVAQSNGSATLAWEPPTENTDGSALTNLKGYKIHYGKTSGHYDQTVTVNNAGVTTYQVDNLAPGTYFFAISALTTSGIESELSAEASKNL